MCSILGRKEKGRQSTQNFREFAIHEALFTAQCAMFEVLELHIFFYSLLFIFLFAFKNIKRQKKKITQTKNPQKPNKKNKPKNQTKPKQNKPTHKHHNSKRSEVRNYFTYQVSSNIHWGIKEHCWILCEGQKCLLES